MKLNNIYLVLVVFSLCISFVSAEILDKSSENILTMEILENISCGQVKSAFDVDYINYTIPDGIPFKNEFFNVYIDDEFFVFAKLTDKKLTEVLCDESKESTYNVYITRDFIMDTYSKFPDIDTIDYYNQNKKSGELKIEAVGFGRKLKMGFINFGLKVASWFN